MIAVRIGQNGLDALRAYNPERMYYSGLNGVLSLLGHCVVELVYQRAYEPRPVDVAANRRYDRVRGPGGRFGAVVSTPTVKRIEYRDRTQRSVVPVKSSWLGAKYRRMLVTRDFAMLNSWGGPTFGFRPPRKGMFKGEKPDIIVVWDCIWHDWRRIKITEPISVSAVIPCTIYPGVDSSRKPDAEARRLIEIEKRVLFSIYEANFHGKGDSLFSYMDNRRQFGLQMQEENLRKKLFKEYEDHQEELRKRREKDAERRRKKKEEEERQRREEEERRKTPPESSNPPKPNVPPSQGQMPLNQPNREESESMTAERMANEKTNIEKPGDVEIKPEGTSERMEDISEVDNADYPDMDDNGQNGDQQGWNPNRRKFK